MPNPAALPLPVLILLFLAAAAIILAAGSRLAGAADKLADATGLGEAMTGAIIMGAITSLPGIVTSVAAAAQNHPELAVSNAMGGIAAQTAFLVIADFAYRRANLEHAAVSLANLVDGAALIGLIALVLLAASGPEVSILGVHPVTPFLFAAYLFSKDVALKARKYPMWKAEQTTETRYDRPDDDHGKHSIVRLSAEVAFLGLITAVAGFAVAQTGIGLIETAGWQESLVGAVFTALATSTPELVTTIAAVRRGALQLAVGGILGGNTFDVLFAGAADAAYREGSIYHVMGADTVFLSVLAVVMTTILLMGLLRRQPHGFANIGFESFAVLLFYLGGLVVIAI